MDTLQAIAACVLGWLLGSLICLKITKHQLRRWLEKHDVNKE